MNESRTEPTRVSGGLFDGAELIHSYTRAQAIADGVLVDVTEVATEAGFKVPVAITVGAWIDLVKWDEADGRRKNTYQDERGRLWDVLFMAFSAIKRHTSAEHTKIHGPGRASFAAARYDDRSNEITYTLLRVPREGRGQLPRKASAVIHSGPGDQGEHVITIMLPGED
jgi:hypothetical protein